MGSALSRTGTQHATYKRSSDQNLVQDFSRLIQQAWRYEEPIFSTRVLTVIPSLYTSDTERC